jgi:predicted GTPase
MSIIKVLIFGKTNVGKTSLCNLLLGCNEATSASAMGCTFETKCLTGSDPLGNNYSFWDTCGLNEPSGGRVEKKEAILKLIELIKSLNDGLSLILYVRKAEALTELDQKNLELITVFTENKIPVLIVNTNADGERETVMNWWKRNEHIFRQNDKFVFTDGVSVCVGHAEDEDLDRILENKRIQSKQILWDAIRRNKLDSPLIFIKNRSYSLQLVLKVMQKIWNFRIFNLFSLSDIGDFFRPDRSLSREAELKNLLIDEGFEANEAIDITLSFRILD